MTSLLQKSKKNKLSYKIPIDEIKYLFIINLFERDRNGNVGINNHIYSQWLPRFFIYEPSNNIIRKIIDQLFYDEDKLIESTDPDKIDTINSTKYEVIKLLKLFGYFREEEYSLKENNDTLMKYKKLFNEEESSDESIDLIDHEFDELHENIPIKDDQFTLRDIGKVKSVNESTLYKKGYFKTYHRTYFTSHRDDYGTSSSEEEEKEDKEKIKCI